MSVLHMSPSSDKKLPSSYPEAMHSARAQAWRTEGVQTQVHAHEHHGRARDPSERTSKGPSVIVEDEVVDEDEMVVVVVGKSPQAAVILVAL